METRDIRSQTVQQTSGGRFIGGREGTQRIPLWRRVEGRGRRRGLPLIRRCMRIGRALLSSTEAVEDDIVCQDSEQASVNA